MKFIDLTGQKFSKLRVVKHVGKNNKNLCSRKIEARMKQYPSIAGPSKAPHDHCIAFYKHDGSNLRWEWSKKKSWNKFGTRTQMFDATEKTFGPAIEIFMKKYAEPLEKTIVDSKDYRNADYATAFTEYFGPRSFAGQHREEDKKDLVLFDIQIFKKGLLGPREFLKNFSHVETAKVVYEGNLNTSFIEAVRNSLPGDGQLGLDEGVVCKGGSGHGLWMRKVKTNQYQEKLKRVYADCWQEFWE